MPRNPTFVALSKLSTAKTNLNRAEKAVKLARTHLNAAMIKAVESGVSRGEVARICEISPTRVSQIPGMPPGPNIKKVKP